MKPFITVFFNELQNYRFLPEKPNFQPKKLSILFSFQLTVLLSMSYSFEIMEGGAEYKRILTSNFEIIAIMMMG
jgi:hypothetical protein